MGVRNLVSFNETVNDLEGSHYVTVATSWNLASGGHYLGFKREHGCVFIRRIHDCVETDATITIIQSDFDTIARHLGYVKQEEE